MSNLMKVFVRNLSNKTASITKVHRAIYARTYPTALVNPDGSSTNINYHEPRKIIKLPLNLESLSESEKRMRLERRKPKTKIKVEEDIKDSFNANKYLKYIRKKK